MVKCYHTLGFEAYDPTNMYQFSYAYDYATEGGQDIYDAYADGASVDYATDMFSVWYLVRFRRKMQDLSTHWLYRGRKSHC